MIIGGCDTLKEAVSPDEEAAEKVKQSMGILGETTDEELLNLGPLMQHLVDTLVSRIIMAKKE